MIQEILFKCNYCDEDCKHYLADKERYCRYQNGGSGVWLCTNKNAQNEFLKTAEEE